MILDDGHTRPQAPFEGINWAEVHRAGQQQGETLTESCLSHDSSL